MDATGTRTNRDTITIGGASAMWGDSAIATPQLLTVPHLDYLVYDYLAETTMSILARAKEQSSELGYATDFVATTLADHLPSIVERGIRVIANAGGLNPLACCTAIERLAAARGLRVRVAAVTGDDVLGLAGALQREGVRGMDGEPWPDALVSANAYLGAQPIAAALARGAHIVVTGRIVDSALVVAPLVHELGWSWTDYDRLAQATLAGHIIECGAQATGGLFTDWESSVFDWDRIGYPFVECARDGSVLVGKPEGTGGIVDAAAVAEQIVYEVGDPSAYEMPDVRCDWTQVRVEDVGDAHGARVRVTGARGLAPSSSLKVSATCRDGYQIETLLAIRGMHAPEKARRTADALLARTWRQMREAGCDDYSDVVVELLGCESLYGPHARAQDTREVVLRVAARHRERGALEYLRREAPSAGTSMGPGTRGHFGGRAEIRPVVRLFPFLIDKTRVHPMVHIGGQAVPVGIGVGETRASSSAMSSTAVSHRRAGAAAAADSIASAGSSTDADALVRVPLVAVARARSGDKGDTCNIGVLARTPELFDYLRATLTADLVAEHMAHLLSDGRVERFEWPGLHALNFVLSHALAGGGMASLRSDPLGKSFAQILLDMPISVPASLMPSLPPPHAGTRSSPQSPSTAPASR